VTFALDQDGWDRIHGLEQLDKIRGRTFKPEILPAGRCADCCGDFKVRYRYAKLALCLGCVDDRIGVAMRVAGFDAKRGTEALREAMEGPRG
jgi:hypothetical protein